MNTHDASIETLNAYAKILRAYETCEDDVDKNISILLHSGFCRNVEDAANTIHEAIVDFAEGYKFLPSVGVAVHAMLESVIEEDLTRVIGKKIEFEPGYMLDFTDESMDHIINYINSQRDYDILDDTKMLPISRHAITFNINYVANAENSPSM